MNANANTIAQPFSYNIKVLSNSEVELYVTSGVFQKRHIITENIANLVAHLRELLELNFYAPFETTVPTKSTKSTKLTIAIYPPGAIDPESKQIFNGAVFRLGAMYVPIVANKLSLVTFLNSMSSAMCEFQVVSGRASNCKYVLPCVTYTMDGHARFYLSVPNLTGMSFQTQTLTLGSRGLVGLIDLIDSAKLCVPGHVAGSKFRNSMDASGSGNGWVFTSEAHSDNDKVMRLTTVAIFLSTHILPLLRDALLDLCDKEKKWKTAVFESDDFKGASLITRCSRRNLVNPFPAPEKAPEGKEPVLSFPLKIPACVMGAGMVFQTRADLDKWMSETPGVADVKERFLHVLAKVLPDPK